MYLHLLCTLSFSFITLLFSAVGSVSGAATNRTIDDTAGDSVTGARPVYLPSGIWDDKTCTGCHIQPDPSQAFNGTWRAATFFPEFVTNMTVQFGFEGTAIYVYFILANTIPDTTTLTECNFTLDGLPAGSFTHTPTTSTKLQYNALVFSQTGLTNANHTFMISTAGLDHEAFVNFDYAQYTYEDIETISSISAPAAAASSSQITGTTDPNQSTSSSSSSSSTPVGAIVGGVFGGLLLLAVLVVVLVFCRRRRRKDSNYDGMGGAYTGSSPKFITPFKLSHRQSTVPTSVGFSSSSSFTVAEKGFSVPLSTSNAKLRRERQAEIERQMRVIDTVMRDLTTEAAELDALMPNNAHDRTGRQNGRGNGGGEQDQLEDLKAQIQLMKRQIMTLQSQQESPWAQGLSDTPPPGYAVVEPVTR